MKVFRTVSEPRNRAIQSRAIELTNASRKVIVRVAAASLACAAMVALSGCDNPPLSGPIGPSHSEIVGAWVGIGAAAAGTAAIVIAVHHAHHTLKGCTASGPGGLEIEQGGDRKLYTLTGNTPSLKEGELVKLHGTKRNKAKDGTAGPTFEVETITKDYGPCRVESKTAEGSPNRLDTPRAE